MVKPSQALHVNTHKLKHIEQVLLESTGLLNWDYLAMCNEHTGAEHPRGDAQMKAKGFEGSEAAGHSSPLGKTGKKWL